MESHKKGVLPTMRVDTEPMALQSAPADWSEHKMIANS